MKVTQRSYWAVFEFTPKDQRKLDECDTEAEALALVSEYNKKGDYIYVAIPLICTTRSGKFSEFNLLVKGL